MDLYTQAMKVDDFPYDLIAVPRKNFHTEGSGCGLVACMPFNTSI
jgi:hypothetical protein